MKLTIRELEPDRLQDVNRCDSAFTVDSKLVLNAENGVIDTTFVKVITPYQKQYPMDELDAAAYIASPDRAIFLAYLDGQLAGQIRLCRYWNRYAYIEDIAVHPPFRRQGVGQALIKQAITWAKVSSCPGIMLETQNINTAACRLYARCGLQLSGFDTCLYRGIQPGTDEIALYWYLIF